MTVVVSVEVCSKIDVLFIMVTMLVFDERRLEIIREKLLISQIEVILTISIFKSTLFVIGI